jgi:hypothetical protein
VKHVVGITTNNAESAMLWYSFTMRMNFDCFFGRHCRALCLRFPVADFAQSRKNATGQVAAALWPKRHKSYTPVIGARFSLILFSVKTGHALSLHGTNNQ